MTVHEFYAYLVRARHDLWEVLTEASVCGVPMSALLFYLP